MIKVVNSVGFSLKTPSRVDNPHAIPPNVLPPPIRSCNQEVVTGYIASLRERGAFGADGEAGAESPVVELWALFLLAQHHSQLENYEVALETIDAAIAHTPTVIDLYICKARIYKVRTFPGWDGGRVWFDGSVIVSAFNSEAGRKKGCPCGVAVGASSPIHLTPLVLSFGACPSIAAGRQPVSGGQHHEPGARDGSRRSVH